MLSLSRYLVLDMRIRFVRMFSLIFASSFQFFTVLVGQLTVTLGALMELKAHRVSIVTSAAVAQ
jgi:hypothetical protein